MVEAKLMRDAYKTDLTDGGETSLHSHAGGGIPSGVIVMWSGLKSAIPTGWKICDGTLSTPDLRDRFILSVGASDEPGGTGGASSLSHAQATTSTQTGTRKGGTSGNATLTDSHSHTVTVGAHADSRPPYYKLAFIMKA